VDVCIAGSINIGDAGAISACDGAWAG